jgi:hypothetical protein
LASVVGGFSNTAKGGHASVSGGESNGALAIGTSVLGGFSNTASTNCQTIPATNTC